MSSQGHLDVSVVATAPAQLAGPPHIAFARVPLVAHTPATHVAPPKGADLPRALAVLSNWAHVTQHKVAEVRPFPHAAARSAKKASQLSPFVRARVISSRRRLLAKPSWLGLFQPEHTTILNVGGGAVISPMAGLRHKMQGSVFLATRIACHCPKALQAKVCPALRAGCLKTRRPCNDLCRVTASGMERVQPATSDRRAVHARPRGLACCALLCRRDLCFFHTRDSIDVAADHDHDLLS